MKIPDWLYQRLEPHMIDWLRKHGWIVFERAVWEDIKSKSERQEAESRMTKLELDAAKSSKKPGLGE